MACFKFPKSVCNEINSACAKFWWGQKEDEARIHWKSWFDLSMSKCSGGMGFRDLNLFNTALLAKQAWRLIQEPDSLWARVLKGIYFPASSFLEASKGSKASWSWSSILQGRDLLKDKLTWQVLDGEKIKIWDDPWLLSCPGKKLSNPEITDCELPRKVSELIDKDLGQWDLSSIANWLSPEELECIMNTPLCSSNGSDRMIWPLTVEGSYSVKSGYQCLKDSQPLPQPNRASSSRVVDSKVWSLIWNLNIPNKIRVFIWKCCQNIVASFSILSRRHIGPSALCPLCMKEEETIEHLLLLCEWTRCIWFDVCFGLHISRDSLVSFDSWLLSLVESPDLDKGNRDFLLTSVGFTCWGLWKARCDVIYGKANLDVLLVSNRIKAAIFEFISLKSCSPAAAPVSLAINQNNDHWEAPPHGWIKLNCDGSYKATSKQASIGVVVRDHNSKVVDGVGVIVPANCPLVAEALAVKEGFNLAVRKNFPRVIIETDSAVLHANVMKNGKP